jgi:hypothetical protein
VCGKDTVEGQATLPTPEAVEAARREAAWLAGHPEAARVEAEAIERVRAVTAESAAQARAGTRPEAFGQYSDVGYAAKFLVGLLVVQAVTSAALSIFCVMYLSTLGGETDATYATSGAVETAADRVSVFAVPDFALYVATAVLFVVWTYRAYRNLPALGAPDMRFGKGWAIGGWFVPILALWRPKQIVNDIWRTGDEGLPANALQREWGVVAVPAMLTFWWAAWLVTIFGDRIATRYGSDALAHERTRITALLISSIAKLVAALAAAWMVSHASRRQQARAERLARMPARAPAFAGAGPEQPA